MGFRLSLRGSQTRRRLIALLIPVSGCFRTMPGNKEIAHYMFPVEHYSPECKLRISWLLVCAAVALHLTDETKHKCLAVWLTCNERTRAVAGAASHSAPSEAAARRCLTQKATCPIKIRQEVSGLYARWCLGLTFRLGRFLGRILKTRGNPY